MNDRFRRLRAAFEAARAEADPLRRERVLLETCGGDQDLMAEVRELLADQPGPGFLETPPAATPTLPTKLGEFELVRPIGSGGSGTVWLARQPSLDRNVAVKVVLDGGTSDATLERFHRESRAIASLSHPHIVPVLSDGTTGVMHWFAMQYVDGHGLDVELRRQRDRKPNEKRLLPDFSSGHWFAAVAQLCADAADALHTAHERGIVHRDVKPANLLLDHPGRVLVVDFGIARDERFGALTEPGSIAGTWHYMSPEQARVADLPVDHRTDVYSLGVVLYELLTLQRPYEGQTSFEVIESLKRRVPRTVRAWNQRTPRDLETICMAAMAQDPTARYPTAAALRDDLRRFLGHEAILQQPPTWRARFAQGMRARRRSLMVALGCVVAAGVGILLQSQWAAAAGRDTLRQTLAPLLAADDFELVTEAQLAAAWIATGGDDGVEAQGVRRRLLEYRDRLLASSAEALAPKPGAGAAAVATDERETWLRGMFLWSRAAAIFVDDVRVAAARPIDAFQAQVAVRLVDGAGASVPGSIALRSIDGLSSLPGPVVLSALQVGAPVRLPAGPVRFEVATAAGERREFDRFVAAARAYEFEFVVRPVAQQLDGMVRIAGGDLQLPPSAAPSGLAGRRTAVPGFWIDRCEVTVAEYRAFCQATGRSMPWGSERLEPRHDRMPIVHVSFDDAVAYAEWAGKRLPTVAEWLLAAHGPGPSPRRYPWGDVGMHGNVAAPWTGTQSRSDGFALWLLHAAVVDADPASCSPEGVFELFGNVEEWTGSAGVDRGPAGAFVRSDKRVVCGHAMHVQHVNPKAHVGQTLLADFGPTHFSHLRGFRCARSTER